MKDIQLVFFDIDDTLYRKATQTVPDSALSAIRQLRKKGIHTAIATGRSPAAIPEALHPLFKDGSFDLLVSINGQYNCQFTDNGSTVISHHPMDIDYIKQVIDYMREKGWEYAGISESAMVSSANTEVVRDALKGIGGVLVDPDYPLNHTIYQMLLFLDEEQLNQFQADGMIHQGFEALRWHPYGVDLVQKNGAKSRGIKDVCQYFKLSPEQTMAFGDGHNDVEMMQYVGIGVAMGDAREEVKAVADYITGTIEEDGILNALQHFKLLNHGENQ